MNPIIAQWRSRMRLRRRTARSKAWERAAPPDGPLPAGTLEDICYGVSSQNPHELAARKKLEKEFLERAEKEKERIASDLHDEICQDLAAISLISRLLEKRLVAEGCAHAKVAGQIATMTKAMAVTARNLVHNLAPAHLAGNNFVRILRRIAESVSTAFRVKCTVKGTWPARLTDDVQAIHLYRIAHEAMHNAGKHSGGGRIDVELATTKESFTITVADDGAGFTPGAKQQPGLGLNTMEYRAGAIGAALKIRSVPGRGTTVSCTLPLK